MQRAITFLVLSLLIFIGQGGTSTTEIMSDPVIRLALTPLTRVALPVYTPDPPDFVSDRKVFRNLIDNGLRKISAGEAAGKVQWYTTDPDGRKRSNWETVKKSLNFQTRIIVFHNTGDLPSRNLSMLKEVDFWEIISECDERRLYYDPAVSSEIIRSNHLDGLGRESYNAYTRAFLPDGRSFTGLAANQVGFQAGNRVINLQGEGWVMVGNFCRERPTEVAINTAAAALKARIQQLRAQGISYSDIWVIGHRTAIEARAPTACPGDWWFDGGREELLKRAGLATMGLPTEPVGWSQVK